ncbi:hydroxysqualene dehydroxylase HpnE [Ramlibacter sp. MAHUQ-53]|uniref:hydroxysqualene dehydroxylase HpnE n=1 Tax=unclassified Ramlibacter TaxID=2617605 RepID=UPI0036445906
MGASDSFATAPRLAIVGGGWAGLAAAVEAVRAGHQVTLFEAARSFGGRARTLDVGLPGGGTARLDNGQHVLIGAYRQTLALMEAVGVDPAAVLHAMPLALRDPQGRGLALPPWPAPLDAAWGIVTARGWSWRERLALLRAAGGWRRAGFRCASHLTVAALCEALPARVVRELVEPLCVSALNTPVDRASGAVFLRVMRDALFGRGWGRWGGSWLLLPQAPLGELLPEAAARWLTAHGATLRLGHRVSLLVQSPTGWLVDGDAFESVVLACPSWDALRLVEDNAIDALAWQAQARALRHEAIATVYATGGPRLPAPMLALASGPDAPAQFVFDRGQLGGPEGLLAFVASASRGEREAIEEQVMAQACALGWDEVRPLRTVVEKRATFACTPGLERPGIAIAPGLWACGDWVDGPYPATLEGAVLSAQHAVGRLSAMRRTAR